MKPLILLDFDGVVNSWTVREPPHAAVIESEQDMVAIPHETVAALRVLFDLAEEVLWCSARRETSNKWIGTSGVWNPPLLGVELLGVVTDGRSFQEAGFTTEWKLEAVKADPRVLDALDEQRPVWWIEDFEWSMRAARSGIKYTDIVELGIKPMDTADIGHLTLRQMVRSGIMDGVDLDHAMEAEAQGMQL